MSTELQEIVARVEMGGAVTKEEAIAVVRSIKRTCKGPIKKNKLAEYGELRRAAGNFGGGNTGYDIGLVDSLNREGCGYDFNNVVVSYPFDGQEHIVNCPNCKQQISFRSPYFKLSD